MFEGYELVVYSLVALAFTIAVVLIKIHIESKDDDKSS